MNLRLLRLLLALAVVAPTLFAAAATRKPDIVIFLADDMGWSDPGCYGGEIETPNLDRLAAGGLRFTQFYNTGRCCPTRASLLTGLYPHQAGVGHMVDDKGLPGYTGDLNRECVTIAEVLRPAGYRTLMSGKWHVTKSAYNQAADPATRANWPRRRGFDRFFGTVSGGGSYYDPPTLALDDDLIPPGPDFYYTDAIGAHAAQFIRETPAEQPLFLYVAFTAPHWPLHAKPADIARYKGRYDRGWDALRGDRHRRQIEMGLLDKAATLSPRDPGAKPWDEIRNPEWFARRMEVYAAQLDCLDQNVGRVLDTLRAAGRLDNTLVLFLADNGGCAEELGSSGEPRNLGGKGPPAKVLGPDEPQVARRHPVTRDGLPVREGVGVMAGPADTYLSYGLSWANLSNTPFRLFKSYVHEGGIATPLIAHWPAGIARRGEIERQPGHLIDLMATCVDVSGAVYPREVNGVALQPLEGISLVPAFAGKPLERAAPLIWEHQGNRALRQGDWKIVAKGPAGAWELYDLAADRSELHNLADQHPDRLRALAALWDEHARRTRILPWPWKQGEE